MQALGPHYLLFTDSVSRTCQVREWRFVLQPTGEGERIVASDVEARRRRDAARRCWRSSADSKRSTGRRA